MDSDDQPILELLVNTAIGIYNSGGFSKWSTNCKTYEPFFGLVYPRIKAAKPRMLDGENNLRRITRDFHGFITRYLRDYKEEHRCSGIDPYWKEDILKKAQGKKFLRHINRLEAELSKPN